jgi:uroporphyrinogen decarboxylase
MDSRNRVLRAIHFEQPDRVPISHAVLPAVQIKYGDELNEILAAYPEGFGWDYQSDMPPEEFPALYRLGRNRDDFGTLWQSERLGICGIPVEYPIADLNRYNEYRWPADFTAGPPRWRQYSGHMAGYDPRWYARGAWITYFEQLQQLRGMQDFLMDLAYGSAGLERLMDDLLAFNLRWIEKWTKLEYDGLHFADDWGSQAGLMIQPKKWQRLFKPRYAEMFAAVRQAGMDVWFHSDGKINNILPDLVKIGVTVINCQASLVGYDWIAGNLRGKVAFRTDIDRQQILPFGTPGQVQEAVHKTFEACGTSAGGIVACGEIGPDVPLESIRAMYAAFHEYGNYHDAPA